MYCSPTCQTAPLYLPLAVDENLTYLQVAAIKIQKAYRANMVSYDPLELVRLTGVDPDGELVVSFNGKPLDHRPGSATEKQKRYLWARDCRSFDWERISMAQASLAISAIEKHGSIEKALEALGR